MANTFGHTVRRYFGHKAYLAEIAQRKATPIADLGADPSDAPFWADAPEPDLDESPDWGEIEYQDMMADARAHERALLASAVRCICTPTMREAFECCAWCELCSVYSDTFKERNGFRPRPAHGFKTWTGLDFDRELQRLYAQPFHDD